MRRWKETSVEALSRIAILEVGNGEDGNRRCCHHYEQEDEEDLSVRHARLGIVFVFARGLKGLGIRNNIRALNNLVIL